MKSYHLLFYIFFLQSVFAFSQAPDKISYQASIYNADNSVLANARIALKIVIRQSSLADTSIYEEVHGPVTSSNGIVSLEIGNGTTILGDFSAIDWSNGPFFIETLVDVNNGSSYKLQGSSQLLSVPYALHANTADRITESGYYVKKAQVVAFENSRNANPADIGNIIACTADATLTIINNFADMQIGDIINLEAHNGATLIIETADQVALNYSPMGSASFSSASENVRFGLLRKIAENAYIISGQ